MLVKIIRDESQIKGLELSIRAMSLFLYGADSWSLLNYF